MSKIRLFDWGSFEYFEHCPFCGSVAVDFDRKTFHCPDCGATVTFDLTESEDTRDGESDVKRIVQLWNKRARNQITAAPAGYINSFSEALIPFSYHLQREARWQTAYKAPSAI